MAGDCLSTFLLIVVFIKEVQFTGPRLSNGAVAFRLRVQEVFNLVLNYVLMSETREMLPVRAPVISLFIMCLFGRFMHLFIFLYLINFWGLLR